MFHRAARGMPADDDVLYGEDGHGILDARRHVHLGLEARAHCRSSAQRSAGIPRATSTTRGSKSIPEPFRNTSSASERERAGRYGRACVMASRVSTTAKMRPVSGLSSPFVPWGYPEPSYRT